MKNGTPRFWNEIAKDTKNGVNVCLSFNYVNTFDFLKDNGFYNHRMPGGKCELIRIENGEIKPVDVITIRNFIKDYLRKIDRPDVLDMIIRGGSQYLSADKLMFLDFYDTQNT